MLRKVLSGLALCVSALGVAPLALGSGIPGCRCAVKLDGGRAAASADHDGHPKCGANAEADRSVRRAGPAV